jgi:hypothetical protein
MISYHVNIPDSKQNSFQDFLESIGATFEKKEEELYLTDQQKRILDERLKLPKSSFIPARESLNKLKKKYEI